jgi:TrmH family RNA methyltransferase
VLPQRWRRLDEVVPTGPWVVVEHLRSTGNLGCILRTCEAAGVEGVFFVGDALDPHDPEVVSTSMGGLLGLSLVRTGWGALGRWCRTHAVALVGSAPGAPLRWDDFRYPERTVVALGDERRGLPAPVLARCDAVVSIPLAGRADSLNVGTAAGVLLFELVRQRLH